MRNRLSPKEHEAVFDHVVEAGHLRDVSWPAGGTCDIVGTADVEGREIRVGLRLGPQFPSALPRVLVYPWDGLGVLPHVTPSVSPDGGLDREGIVCYQDAEGVVLDRRNPGGLAVEALERALDLLGVGVRGENCGDFAEEWEAHWMRVSRGPGWVAVGDLPDRTTELTLFPVGDGALTFLAQRAEDVQRVFKGVALSSTGRRVLYVPLAKDTEPVPPKPGAKSWTASDVRAFIREHAGPTEMDRVGKRARRLRRRFASRSREAVIFSLPRPSGGLTLFGVEYDGVRGAHPVIKGRCDDVRLVAVTRWDRAYVVPRGGADGALGRKRVLIVGCGAVGSRVAVELARAGLLRLTLVDPDTLQMENVFRHVLGLGSFGKGKAEALKVHLEKELPYVEVKAVGARIEDALADGRVDVTECDLVVCALGSPTIEMDLNERIWNVPGAPPVVFTWVEPYGIGGHALLVRPSQVGCFECLYTTPGDDCLGLSPNRASFAGPPPPGRAYGKALSGCGSLFTPYGSADAAQSALLAVRLGVGALTEEVEGSPLLSWKGDAGAFTREGFVVTGRYRKGQDQLDGDRFGYVSSACPVCRVAT